MYPKIVAIVGPTASGKTDLGIHLAQAFHSEIISADSRQIYKEFNIGTAKPTPEQRKQVPHYLVDCIEPNDLFTVKDFEVQMNTILLNKNHLHLMLVVGGTGLYMNTLLSPIDPIPDIPSELRSFINEQYQLHGIQYLLEQLERYDPAVLKQIDVKNPRRLTRALEVVLHTGKSILDFWNNPNPSPIQTLWIGICPEKQTLHRNISLRIESMLKQGWIDETRELIKKYPPHLEPFNAIGYPQIVQYLKNEISFEQMVSDISLATRQYAKRQFTWFKKNKLIHWFETIEDPRIGEFIRRYIE